MILPRQAGASGRRVRLTGPSPYIPDDADQDYEQYASTLGDIRSNPDPSRQNRKYVSEITAAGTKKCALDHFIAEQHTPPLCAITQTVEVPVPSQQIVRRAWPTPLEDVTAWDSIRALFGLCHHPKMNGICDCGTDSARSSCHRPLVAPN